jgi:hypothetical protein
MKHYFITEVTQTLDESKNGEGHKREMVCKHVRFISEFPVCCFCDQEEEPLNIHPSINLLH